MEKLGIDARPLIRKLGTIDVGLVEATPVVFKGKLYRYEYVRPPDQYPRNKTSNSYFRFVDHETKKPTPGFAAGYHFGSAFVEDDIAYAFGVDKVGGERIQMFCSQDLMTWESREVLTLPGWKIYNNSVCKGRDGYVMAFEIGAPPEETGVGFTSRFAVSNDLRHWTLTPFDHAYSRERYTACPALRYLPGDGFYYMIYLEGHFPDWKFESYIVRSRDLIHWESSPLNPLLTMSPEDRLVANPAFTPEDRARIAAAENINNSDVDLCEFEGRTILTYSWGSQRGVEHLAEAVCPMPLKEFLQSFFSEQP